MAQYEDVPGRVIADLPFDPEFGLDLREQPRWHIPEKLLLKAALVGTPIKRTTNPHHPYTVEEIRNEAIKCIETGATSIHFHPREDDGSVVLDPERYLDKLRRIIEPLKETYGDRVIIDGCTATLPFPGEAALIKSGLFEEAPVNAYSIAPRRLVEAEAQLMREYGVKPQIAIYCDGDLDRARRWLIEPGLVEKPLYWIIVPAYIIGCTPMPNPIAMTQALIWLVSRIREIDSESVIMVCMSGRPSSYLSTQAMLLGLHVRVGMEDSIYRWPHRDDLIDSNATVVADTVRICEALGRNIATADEHRRLVGEKK
jgi:3-keto-5-aminohexanoate cleavage enzyme